MSKDLKISRLKKRFRDFYRYSEMNIVSDMLSSLDKSKLRLRSMKIILSYLLAASIIKCVIFIIILDNIEPVWDRIAVIGLLLASIYLIKLEKELKSWTKVFVSISFVCYSVQILYASYNNYFGEVYILDIFLTLLFVPVTLKRSYLEDILLVCVVFFLIFSDQRMDFRYIADEKFLIYFIASIFVLYRFSRKYLTNSKSQINIHEEFLTEMVKRSENAIFITNFEGDIFDINPKAAKMFGYTKEELKNQNFSRLRKDELTYEEDMSGLNEIFQDRFWRSEIPLIRKDKSEFFGYVSISLIQRKENDYLIYRVKDITDMKESEEMLKKERDKAESADKAKSLFLATMSHEIRTPMNGVIGMAKILEQTDLTEEQREYVHTINRSSNSLVRIINDILDFSKIEAKKIEVENTPFNLHELLTDVIKLYGPLIGSKDINFSMKIGTDVPKVVIGDSLRIKQIINNLVNNAIKFTKKGFVQIYVDRVGGDESSWDLRFSVKDSGSGIPKEKMGLLFKSFSQIDSSDARKFGGSGLGLAICEGLVKLMGGEMSVTSEEGAGSEFSFELNFDVSKEVILPEVDMDKIEAKLANYDLSELKILVAEDNEINQRVVEIILKTMGVSVDIVSDGTEVLDIFPKKDFDIILMDVQMPNLDGIETTKRLLEIYDSSELPSIIALTANALEEDRKKCFEVGMTGFISKPISIPDLKMTILKYLEDRTSVLL